MLFYSNVNLRKWSILNPVDELTMQTVELVHVFGLDASSALYIEPNDEVFAIGNNVSGRLGVGDLQEDPVEVPTRIDQVSGKNVICFSSSSQHVLALTEAGGVYSWGANDYGQLGNGSIEPQAIPVKISFPAGDKIKEISSAERYNLALSENDKLYHWGDTLWTLLHFETTPSLMKLPEDIIITSICCGAHHAAAVTKNGKVLTWGVNDFGQLGSGQVEILETPKVVGGQIEDQFIIQVACSFRATLVLTNEGQLYFWGYNNTAKMPIGYQTEVVNFPLRVLHLTNIINIASNNLLHVLCAEQRDPHNIFVWGCENVGEERHCNDLIEAFNDQAMPVVKRRKRNTSFEKPHAINRDIGHVLFNNKENSDLTVLVSDGEVYVHRLIMRTFSEHFKTLLDDNWTNGKDVINMTQYNPKAYRAFLKYVYTGRLDLLEGTEIIALCDIAVSYFESDLKNLCIDMFSHCLTTENVAQLYALAVGNHSFRISLTHTSKKSLLQDVDMELVNSCIHFTRENLISVILSEGFEQLSPSNSKTLIIKAAESIIKG